MGWSEREYYTCSPEGFFYACRGYFSKLQDNSLAVRNMAAIMMAVNGSKSKIDNIWPLNDSEEKEVYEQPSKEWWDAMKQKQKIVDEQIRKQYGK